MSQPTAFQRLQGYARPQWRMASMSFVLFLLAAMVEPAIPALFKRLIDSGFQEGLKYPIWIVPVTIIGLFLARGFLNFAGGYAMTSATVDTVLLIRRDLMRALLRADSQLFTWLSPGLAVTKIINDPQSASQTLASTIISFIKDSATLLALVGYLVYLNWQLTIISFISLPLLAVTIRTVQKRLNKVGEAQYHAQQRLVSIVDDNARAWRVVRTFDAAEFELHRFDTEAQTLRRLTLKQMATSSLVTPASQVVAAIGVAIIITLALWQASKGSSTVGEFVSFITALLMAISPMRHLTDVYQPVTSALITARGAFELLDAKSETDTGTLQLSSCRGQIDFQAVTVQYPEAGQPSLDRLDLHIKPGQIVALVGASGSGKTTVINALLRFAPVTQGEVLLDGVAISELKLNNLRQNFAVVSQDTVLFDGSIAQNVAYASLEGVNREKVEQCLRAANLWTHVNKLPEGMDALIGTNGSMLSGGQRQRLAIARALYRNAVIWIFDEATSALDSESEVIVQQSIEALRHTKTLIVIAHRLSTVRNADLICVMRDGKIIESGTHADLVSSEGVYADMIKLQSV